MTDIRQGAQIELARRDFFEYCHLKSPEFFKYSRPHLVGVADELQRFSESTDDVLILNEPPRHGKSRTAGNFVEWTFGKRPDLKIMTGSYNETLSTTFSKNVRNTIQEIKADPDRVVYSEVFPGVRIKQGDGAMNLWSLEGHFSNYLATSPTGTATGFGADYLIIDDLIKNASEANNANVLNNHWEWFTNTMLSRLESGGKIILIMTRWHTQDLAGRALTELPDKGYKVRHVNLKALQDDGSMLCNEILSKVEFERKTKIMGADIASANYQQEPIDIKGKLYTKFKTYEKAPTFKRIASYTDTADTGSDNLAHYVYGEYNGEAYILDVVYTKEPMEVTEELVAESLFRTKCDVADIESNNGGRGFARAVERRLREKYRTNHSVIRWFHQSKNKEARIYSASAWVQEHIYFPENWRDRWPRLYKDLTRYQREGKNEHDDAPDALTGISEKIGSSVQVKLFKGGL